MGGYFGIGFVFVQIQFPEASYPAFVNWVYKEWKDAIIYIKVFFAGSQQTHQNYLEL